MFSEVSSTLAVDNGVISARREDYYSRLSEDDVFPPTSDGKGMDSLMLSLTSGTVPGPAAPTVVHSRLPSKSHASFSRQQSRASVNNSQTTPRIPGITQGCKGYAGSLR